jgi:hypothetical protein
MMMDLEAFRISRKLGYRRLAQLIAVGGGRRPSPEASAGHAPIGLPISWPVRTAK